MIDRLAAAEVQEVGRNEHGTAAPPVNAGKYPVNQCFAAICLLSSCKEF